MASLKNHPGMWLRDDAAAAINALEDKYGKIIINSAGRTLQEQQNLIDRWNRGDRAGLYRPAMPASSSNHVKDGGIAVDVYNYSSDRAKLEEFGFKWWGPSDPVHYEFHGWRGAAANDGSAQDTKNRQGWLNAARNAGLAVDGIKGPATTKAYKAYQEFLRGYGYTGAIDGIWGPATQAAHQKYYDEKNAPARPARPSDKNSGQIGYREIQEALNRKGYGLVVDGIWGPKSSNALADFQRKNGLVVDRIVGPLTWDKLNTW